MRRRYDFDGFPDYPILAFKVIFVLPRDRPTMLLMKLLINGEERSFGDPLTLATLVEQLGLKADRVAVELNQNIVRRDDWSTTELHDGDPLKIQVRSPGQISFLYVSYIQADGSVVHLVQPNGLVPQPTLPGQTLVFGSGEEGKPKFTISPPFGREMIVAIASRSPLFDHELPQHETERDYLSELRRALIYKPVPDMPDRELAATITTLQTTTR